MKKGLRLTYEDRCQIHALWKRGFSHADIAWDIAVHRSTIWRELDRNSMSTGYYIHCAQDKAEERQQRRRCFPRKMSPKMVAFIEQKLKQGWRDKWNGGRLYRYLRHRGKRYRHSSLRYKGGRGRIPDRVDIDQRPEIVERKCRLGDWELDTVFGAKRKGALVSMVERRSKLLRLSLVPKHKADIVANAIETALAGHKDKVLTMTMDNGLEFAKHVSFGKSLQAETYFARPYNAWQRGLNEHTNGLVRQYFPKSMDFTKLRVEDVREVEDLLNNRPRAVLGFRTPLEVFNDPKSAPVVVAIAS